VARGQAQLPSRLPTEGLQVGCDENGAVGEYQAPFAFTGKLGQVVLELE
jgi:hypothetical protein